MGEIADGLHGECECGAKQKDKKMNNEELLFIDLETTDVDTQEAKIVEIGAIKGTGEDCNPFLELINPGVPIPPESSAVHHITDDMVKDSPTFEDIIPELREIAQGCNVIVGHNISKFDLPILRAHTPGLSWNRFKVLDTLRLTHHVWDDLPQYKLEVLKYRFDLHLKDKDAGSGLDPHNALYDCYITMNLLDKLFSELDVAKDPLVENQFLAAAHEKMQTGKGSTPMEAVADLSMKPYVVKIMPFTKDKGKLVKDLDPGMVRWLFNQNWFESDYPDLAWTLRNLRR